MNALQEVITMAVIIEKARPSDAGALLAFLKQTGGETDNLSFGSEGLPFSVEAEAEYLEQLENSRDAVMLVAKVDGKIIGSASLNRQPRRMQHRGDFSVSVNSLPEPIFPKSSSTKSS